MTHARFLSHGESRYDFIAEYVVVCPRCEGRARVSGPATLADRSADNQPRFSCTHCGLSRVREPRSDGAFFGPATGAPCDGYFGLPLWLQTPCCGHTLWANNPAHLAFLERFVGARHRERQRDPEHGWNNRSLASRLPRWMQSAKNREDVLRGLDRLRQRLEA